MSQLGYLGFREAVRRGLYQDGPFIGLPPVFTASRKPWHMGAKDDALPDRTLDTIGRRANLEEAGVAVKDLIIDFAEYDLGRVIADIEEIRRYNPQRFEMEQLSAICYENAERNICVGYKDLTENEFWVRGHMPGMPLMPGVVLCEAAAQMASYYSQRHNLLGSSMVGFGGLDEVRFRGVVRPGDRLVIVAQLVKVRRGAMIVARFQCFVEQNLVCEGMIRGIPLSEELIVAARNVTGPTSTG